MSRYSSRYDGDRRSRSPRDRSPDRYNDRRSQYSDGDGRRLSSESRSNQSAFQTNRDTFRDTLTGRDPPRGPKALLDAPSGPRGGFAGDFRGRGRGRGRGWRDDSRDRGRERDDFRDRRDGPRFRDERSRERDRERDRDWRDRDRDNFAGRRPSPQGRGRSPPGRDYRDRDPPLGVDADRARRGSRDGPLSAGSSSSDPPFGGAQSYRGGFSRGGARGGRGRGEWDRGRGRGGYFDDRDRYPRTRSQEGRWGRGDRDDRDGYAYRDSDTRSRDPRDDRDMRDRDARSKLDRNSVSHEPSPIAKDVSPPPIAPSAPAFGSVPSRNPSSADIQFLTGKAPPTGPRALTEERPVSAGHQAGATERLVTAGALKPSILNDSPPIIPTGPRAQQQKQQRPSSKQWINPNLVGKKIPESPKINRSQSFASQQGRPFGARPESAGSEHTADFNRRPRSSDAKAESQLDSADGQLRSLYISEPGEIKPERGTQSARASIERDTRGPFSSHSLQLDADRTITVGAVSPSSYKTASPALPRAEAAHNDEKRPQSAKATDGLAMSHPRGIKVKVLEFAVPPRLSPPAVDQGSDSDDEDMDDYFDSQIAKAEADLKELEEKDESLPLDAYLRAGLLSVQSALKMLSVDVGLHTVLEPLPEDVEVTWKIAPQVINAPSAEMADSLRDNGPAVPDSAPLISPTKVDTTMTSDLDPLPKVEEMDTDAPHLPIPTVERDDARLEDGDVVMHDALDAATDLTHPHISPRVTNGIYPDGQSLLFPPGFEHSQRTTPSQLPEDEEDDDATEIEEVDFATIETVRQYMQTPPLEELPVFDVTEWELQRELVKPLSPTPSLNGFILGCIRDEAVVKKSEQDEVRQGYRDKYWNYLRFTLSDDKIAINSRERFSGEVHVPEAKATTITQEPKPEGRRTGRWATERDFERILQESKRLEDERKEREIRAQKEKFRSEKEAFIPNMYWNQEDRDRDLFIDKSGFLPPEKLVAGWEVLPPVVNFTQEEAEQFEKAYLEFPKQWGRIAEQVPKRDFQACIQYYYSRKRDLNLKEKLKKQPRKRKKNTRGKQRSSALVSELGNGDNELEETTENGENGERRRPRRAAAPNFGNFEASAAADSDGTTTGTPGRRRADTGAKNDSGAEKPEGKKSRRRAPKELKPPKTAQTLAPQPAPGAKPSRSRSNSRAQGPEWQSPQGAADVTRLPTQFESPQGAMQPPMVPAQPLLSPERPMPAAVSSLSEVMAPPSLRPEPPPPQASMASLDFGQAPGPERIRTPQQASSYWSVSEANDFPHLLRSYGTDWHSIASHMQTKTAVMVKNYYVRQKDTGGKTEWETIATDADGKKSRGEKLPPAPLPTTGPRKRYDGPSAIHRPLAAAADMADDAGPSKVDAQPPSQPNAQSFGRFQVPVPIAQAPPIQAPVQAAVPPLPAQQSPIMQPASQPMSPSTRPLRAPIAQFGYNEREPEPAPSQQQQQPVRISQKPPPSAGSPVQEPLQQRPSAWADPTEAVDARLHSMSQKHRQKADLQHREEPRQVERAPPRLKQEPEAGHHFEAFPSQPQVRPGPPRGEPLALSRQPEPSRAQAPPPQAYTPPVQQLVSRGMHAEPAAPQVSAAERGMGGMQRPMAIPAQEPYSTPTPQPAPAAVAPPPSRPEPPKKSSLFDLLNDDPPAAPKRVSDVSVTSMKSSSTPPPHISARPPPTSSAAPLQPRREAENSPYPPYSRNPQSQSAMPPLKPSYTSHAQSPQPQHIAAPRPSMVSPVETAVGDRDYYSRRPYQPQHSGAAGNSPQTHPYPPTREQAQMGYQQPTPYPPYAVPSSQPHSASPTPHYAGHPSVGGRRENLPSGRETPWPPPESRGMTGSQQPPLQPQPGWPNASPHPGPPKEGRPPPPPQSAWGAQHGGPPKAPPVSGPHPSQPSWSSSQAPQQPPHHLGIRDERGYPVHDPRTQPQLQQHPQHQPQHQHSHSLGGRYPPPRAEAPPPLQAAYPRYATPGPGGQPRDPRDQGPPRSYTPGVGYDARGPPPGPPYPGQDPRGDPQDPRGQQPPPSMLHRQLRPHDDYNNRPPERYAR